MQWVTEEIKEKIKFLETNEDDRHSGKQLRHPKRKVSIHNKTKLEFSNNLIVHLKILEK